MTNSTSLPAASAAWATRWLHPSRRRGAALAFVVVALGAAVTLLVYETGGTRFAWLHLMYLPIILSAAVYGLRGGLATALAGGLAVGPFMPMSVEDGAPQAPSNWIFRIVFFLLVGAMSGLVSHLLNAQIDRLQEANRNLRKAHEDLKNTQLQLVQTAKLESVGRLAAGLAHEVKNPLAVIQLGVDYLTRASPSDAGEDYKESVAEMADAVRRADEVIKGLLNFSRSEPLAPVEADLNAVIDEALALVRHDMNKRGVELARAYGEGLPAVALDRNKIKQVLINVFMNAAQSMDGRGELRISTRRLGPSATPPGHAPSPAGWVQAEILDSGPGIPTDKLDKLFEPFFTTKPVGSGTGLGLSISRNIIEMHQGAMSLANRTDARGAVVCITLPITEGTSP